MVRRAGKRKRILQVHAEFEPNRLAGEHLADAYERIVPILRRSLQADAVGKTTQRGCRLGQVAGVER